MQCLKCGEVRLSSEFPTRTGKSCAHPSLWCLECTISNSKDGKCPECHTTLSQRDIQQLGSFFNIITQDDKFNPPIVVPLEVKEGFITVTLLTGENSRFPYDSKATVEGLQNLVATSLHVPARHQKLMYKNSDVKIYNKNGKALTLLESGLQPGAMLQCMRLMYAIGRNSGLNKVVFELQWGYPPSGRDYLDGSCMVYSKQKLQFSIDYSNWKVSSTGEDLYHSGDIMNHTTRTGKHTINLSLKNLPEHISHLFFVLSAYKCNDLSLFPNPTVSLCKKWDPRPLCEYSLTSAGKTQAVIMCCLIRNDEGGWTVLAIGKPAQGNVKNYSDIHQSIMSLFNSGSL